MQRYKIIIEYNGVGFVGWQRQTNQKSVQGVIEKAILRLFGINVNVFGASRTDSGVHALGQVAHFDLPLHLSLKYHLDKMQSSLNYFITLETIDCVILEIQKVDSTFHARFNAVEKKYIYKILNRNSMSVILRNQVWHVRERLDIDLMKSGAEVFIGKHDFSSFRSSSCQAASPVKTVKNISISRIDDIIAIEFCGRSFLHNQVRIMTSAIKKVGLKNWSVADVVNSIEAKDRTEGPQTAPAHGLYLKEVRYDF